MGPSVSFPLPLQIAQKLPIRNSWELVSESYRIPLPIFILFREGANREKLTVKKIINSETFFFRRLCPL